MTNFDALGKFGLKMGKFGLKMDKSGPKMDKLGPKMGKIGPRMGKFGLNMRQKVTFLDTVYHDNNPACCCPTTSWRMGCYLANEPFPKFALTTCSFARTLMLLQ